MMRGIAGLLAAVFLTALTGWGAGGVGGGGRFEGQADWGAPAGGGGGEGRVEVSYERQANADAPRRVRIEKRGNYFSMAMGSADADMQPAGGSCKVEMTGDYYVGVGVCSHSVERLETATFSNIALGT